MHYNFSGEHQSFEHIPYVNPVPDESITECLQQVDSPSATALAEHRAPEVAVTLSPADARVMAAVVGDVLPGLSDRLRKVEEPTKLVGMFAIQAERAMAATPLDGLRADDTGPTEAAEAARLALLRDEIAASLASSTPRGQEPIPTHTEAESTLESLGIPPDDTVLDVYLTNRAVARTVEGVKKTHRSHSGIALNALGRLIGRAKRSPLFRTA